MMENWTKFDALFKQYGSKYLVEWRWLKAIAMNESSLGTNKSVALGMANPNNVMGSTSHDGKSWGLMQLTCKTAKTLDMLATPEKLNNPEYSIDLAAQYVSQLKKMFRPNDPRYTEWVIKSYNQGPGNTKNEMIGKSSGFAGEYWRRFKQNLDLVGAYF